MLVKGGPTSGTVLSSSDGVYNYTYMLVRGAPTPGTVLSSPDSVYNYTYMLVRGGPNSWNCPEQLV